MVTYLYPIGSRAVFHTGSGYAYLRDHHGKVGTLLRAELKPTLIRAYWMKFDDGNELEVFHDELAIVVVEERLDV